MAAKGSEEKVLVIEKLMELFPDAFEHEKVLRIPIGEVEIKVSLTCAKDNIRQAAAAPLNTLSEPTEEEVAEVQDLISKMGV